MPSVLDGRRIEVRGTVQGVGFRPWVYRLARDTSLSGRVRNHSAGVTIEVFGPADALDRFTGLLRTTAPAAARIDELDLVTIPFEDVGEFTIVASEAHADRHVSIPPELATCEACLTEIFDPANRRYRYAFTNCTNCGPRFTIARDVPYDRANTTMAPFRMCEACQREYEDVADRRFHAQPNACPACGPRLLALSPDGTALHGDPIRAAASTIASGGIVAVKGLGGFHLACDARSASAVTALRRRKRRDEKPLAVMAPDLAAAEAIAVLGDVERRLLLSVERPIVLAWRREAAGLPEELAPGSRLVGVFLPYTPLHHLLLAECRGPLVMTSGNLSEEPIAYRNDEALRRLSGIADLFLVHDREIQTRCDDSVATVIHGRPVTFRRSRGYVPRPVRLSRGVALPVLGCGALLKNAFCLARGHEAVFGPHIGDLENLETFESFEQTVARMERFLDVRPEVVAHDLHPEYLSTQYAQRRAPDRAVAVQHHHAHVASAMAEHGLAGPVIGVAYDGTGYGTDGTAWGGEILVAGYRAFRRAATCRPLALPGGDLAIRQPWRLALALLDDAFEGAPPIDRLPLFRSYDDRQRAVVRQLVETGVQAPRAHGMGRYFDAFAAMALGRGESRFEGQLALAFNVVAEPGERGSYEYAVDESSDLLVLDLRPAARQAVREVIAGVDAAAISARFHNTIATATAALVRRVAAGEGALPVVLTGGCFQNARLTESIGDDLSRDFSVHTHGDVPPGDGGIALGQVVIAAAQRFVDGS